MRSDTFNVFHEFDGIFENIVIDTLNCVVNDSSCLIERSLIGIIDVTGAVRNGNDKVTVNIKMRTYFSDIVFHKSFFQLKSFSG